MTLHARTWPIGGVLALLTMLAAPALPGAAGMRVSAHAQLVASSPGAGTTVAEAPDELRLVFSEPLEAQVTSLDVADEDGALVLERAGEVDRADQFALVVVGPDLDDGVYTVTWRTLSAADGHTAEGFFTFAVGDSADPPPGGDGAMTHAGVDPLDVAGRWLTYLGLLLAFGAAVIQAGVLRSQPMSREVALGLAGMLAVAALATLGTALVSGVAADSPVDYLIGTRNGGLQSARAATAAVGAVVLLVLPRRTAGVVAGVTGLAGIALLVAAGHAAALPSPVPVFVGIVHVAAAAVWITGLVALLLAIARPSTLFPAEPTRMSVLVPRFSALALVSIGIVGLTGIYSAWTQTGTLLDPTTDYGRTLLAKTVIAGGALAIGGLNFIDGGRMLSWLNGMRTRLTTEVVAVAAVLVVTAILAATSPTEEVPGVSIAPIPDAFGDVVPGMSMTLAPGRPGINRVVVTTTDAVAMTSADLELALDRLDTGTTTRVALQLDGDGMDHGAMTDGHAPSGGTVDWFADALVLPGGSQWDTSVRLVSAAGVELSRQRFAFAISDQGVTEGRVTSVLDPVVAVAVVLLLAGALGVGLALGSARLPRCEALASRWALGTGGLIAVALAVAIGLERWMGG